MVSSLYLLFLALLLHWIPYVFLSYHPVRSCGLFIFRFWYCDWISFDSTRFEVIPIRCALLSCLNKQLLAFHFLFFALQHRMVYLADCLLAVIRNAVLFH